jgi:nitrate reductase gamma subunit
MNLLGWIIGGPLIYFSVAFFVIMTAATFIKYAKLPCHLRWDLYPVPHQGPEGSKYQKVDFAKLKPHSSKFHELKEMIPEMLFIRKAFINNPKVWAGSFPLHLGLYMGLLFLLLLVFGAILELAGIGVFAASESIVPRLVYHLTALCGAISFFAGFLGSLVLLWLRLMDEDMRFISDFVSYFNLGVMILLFGSAFVAWAVVDSSSHIIRMHVAGLLSFNPVPVWEPSIMFQLLMLCSFLIYLPFSRMMHFVGKYFFYHKIMWDDEMMKHESAMESDVIACLKYKTTWSAQHIRKGGSWIDQAVDGPPKEGEKK